MEQASKLTLEQQFTVRNVVNQYERMSDSDKKELFEMTLKQMMIKENIAKEIMKERIGLKDV